MQLNKDIAISTSHILLVPYEPHHVPTYHEWMKDKDIQAATASEPLSLEDEYAMQVSWRHDADKLTFIACQPLPSSPTAPCVSPETATACVAAGTADAPPRLLGDVNLFLTHSPNDSPAPLIGELELMIAPTRHRRRGYGRAALLACMLYLERHAREIIAEYRVAVPTLPTLQLRAKIGAANSQSLALFHAVGFVPLGAGQPNYFGELEMVFPSLVGAGVISEAWAVCIGGGPSAVSSGGLGYREVVYCRG